MRSMYIIRLIIALGILSCCATAENFPYAKETFDAGNKLQRWTIDDVREHRDAAIGDLTGKNSIMEKDNAANSSLLAYLSDKVEARNFETDLDLTSLDGLIHFAIQVDDEAILSVEEILTGNEPSGHNQITETYEVKGTALWRADRSYKEFSTPIPAGRKYNLKLDYRNTANLTPKYNGLVDYDGVNVFLMHHPAVDLDVDSNNDEGFVFTWGSPDEDKIEASADLSEPGKIIAVPLDPDADKDGVSDALDGFDGRGITLGDTQFVQMVVSIPSSYDPETATLEFNYKMSDPRGLSAGATHTTSGFRLWTSDAAKARFTADIPDAANSSAGYFIPAGQEIPWKNLTAQCTPAKSGIYDDPAIILYIETVLTNGSDSSITVLPFAEKEPITVTAKPEYQSSEFNTSDTVNIAVRCTGGVQLSGVKALLVNDDDDYGDDKWDKDNDQAGILDDDVKFFTVTATALDQPIKVMIDSDQLFTSTQDSMPTAPGGLIDGVYPGERLTNGAPTGSDTNGQSKINFQPQVYTISVPANTSIVENLFIEGLKHSDQLEDVVITAEIDASGIYAGKIPCLASSVAKHSLTVYQVDLDIDSNNTEGLEFTEGSPKEDQIENSKSADQPGKVIITHGVLDLNGDKVPDYQNGVDGSPVIAGSKFTPMLLKLPEPYDPAAASFTFNYAEAEVGAALASGIRIWRKNSATPRTTADDLISNGSAKSWAELGGASDSRELKLYVEALNVTGSPAAGKKEITVSVTQTDRVKAEDIINVFLMPVNLQEVRFEGVKYHQLKSDDLTTTYSGPHWRDMDGNGMPTDTAGGERNYSVAYTRNTKPRIGAKLNIPGFSAGLAIKLRAKGSDGIETPGTDDPTILGSNFIFSSAESNTAWPNTIKFYDRSDASKAFKIEWEVNIEGGGWVPVANTMHQVYLTLDDPIKIAGAAENQETLFNLGCRNADGLAVPDAAVLAIWNEFSDRIVSRVTPETGQADLDIKNGGVFPDGMIYWKPASPICRTVEEFLKIGHTSCGTWSQFMQACLNFQGIGGSQVSTVDAPIPHYYLQSTLDYKAHTGFAGDVYYYSYNDLHGNNVPASLKASDRILRFETNNGVNGGIFYVRNLVFGGNKFVPIPPNNQGFPASSSEAQGNGNARAWFGNHAIVKFGGGYYDPSYGGSPYATKEDWEDASLQYFGGLISVMGLDPATGRFAPIDELLWIERNDPKGTNETDINP